MTLNQGNTLECKAFNFTEKKKSGYCKEAPLNSGQHIQLGSHNKLDINNIGLQLWQGGEPKII